MNRISAGLDCCNDRGFNSSLQVCADKDGCGNGTVCDKADKSTAVCNRCDFRNTLYCSKTKGYYTPNPTTPPSQDCGAFMQVVSGNATLRHYNDQNLEPFTEYEYYLVVYNTEGNVSSPTSKNKTLMDAPEGLTPPDVIPRSARVIEIVFSSPSKPNGIISEYKLTRVDISTTAKTLVYRGANLSYNDTVYAHYRVCLYPRSLYHSLFEYYIPDGIYRRINSRECIPSDVEGFECVQY